MKQRYLVPIIAMFVVAVLPTTLITVAARSPYTHANLVSDGSYDRTERTEVGAPLLYQPPSDAVPVDPTAPMEQRGRAVYAARGCAGCHGMDGRGGVVGPRIIVDLEVLRDAVRGGPGGMPVFAPQELTDYDLTAIVAYLESVDK